MSTAKGVLRCRLLRLGVCDPLSICGVVGENTDLERVPDVFQGTGCRVFPSRTNCKRDQ